MLLRHTDTCNHTPVREALTNWCEHFSLTTFLSYVHCSRAYISSHVCAVMPDNCPAPPNHQLFWGAIGQQRFLLVSSQWVLNYKDWWGSNTKETQTKYRLKKVAPMQVFGLRHFRYVDTAKCGNLWPYQHFSTTSLQNNATDSVEKMKLNKFCAHWQAFG